MSTTLRESITARIAALEIQIALERSNLEKLSSSQWLDMAASEAKEFFRWVGAHVFSTKGPAEDDKASAPVLVSAEPVSAVVTPSKPATDSM